MKQCKKNPSNFDGTNQGQLILPAKGSEGEGGHITTWKFDQEASRKALAEMIVIGELPFKFVESEGFRRFMSVACPRFRIPSRLTITRDVYQLYLDEKAKLKQHLKIRQKVKDTLYEVYDGYKPRASSDFLQSNVGNNSSLSEPQQKVKKRMKDLYKRRIIEASGEDQISELDKYLGEASEKYDDDFDILLWWKVNSPRFPTLSKIPLSTVASESAFDCLRNPSTEEEIKKIEEQIQELDKIDNDSSWNALDPVLNS
ncbi:hypothetical protein V6N13_041347 [Hibiscus sabdariffa]